MIFNIEPFFDEKEREEILKVIESGFISEYAATEKFEKEIADFTGSKHVVAYANGTVALLGAYSFLKLKREDEIIVPDLTFIATANSVILAGGTPVLCDVNKETFDLDLKQAEKLITKNTKAIAPVHLYGCVSDMDAVMSFAKKHNLYVIEDAAESFGSFWKGKHSGTIGDFGVLSFYGNKTITTAEGGVILTQKQELRDFSYRYKNVGRAKKGVYIHEDLGHNFRFTDLQAAIGLAQLKKKDFIIKKKLEINKFYKEHLSGIKDIVFQKDYDGAQNVCWLTAVLTPDAAKLKDYLFEKGIQLNRFFYPLHLQPCYEGVSIKRDGDFKVTQELYDRGITLPSSVKLTQKDLEVIVKNIKLFF